MRGYTGLAEQLPPAQVVSILDEFFTMLTRVTVTFGGQVFHMAGDGMMAGFGIRDSRGSGARAALAASHAMLQSFALVAARWRDEFAVVTGIGIGLRSGEVALGFLRPPGKQAITMIGDTANVAARLCSRARAGEVLFSWWPLLFALTPTVWEWERRHSFNCRNSNCAGVANCWISDAYRRLRDSHTENTRGVRWLDGTHVCRGTPHFVKRIAAGFPK
jgi:hypothetical protein